MAILVNLNKISPDGSSTPILVNLDKVCFINTYTVPDQDQNAVEGAKLFFDHSENEIVTVETQREIYLLALSLVTDPKAVAAIALAEQNERKYNGNKS
tara:strand:- start:134 stop:427 length:294 start_codon:yes stop_codon:yes gene_type:complete